MDSSVNITEDVNVLLDEYISLVIYHSQQLITEHLLIETKVSIWFVITEIGLSVA